jgi:hypothetical protein
MKRDLLVVGDSYGAFANREGVVTETDLRLALASETVSDAIRSVAFGQGISLTTRQVLSRLFEAREIDCVGAGELAPLRLTHKQAQENVLISPPIPLGAKRYLYGVHIDEKVDRLSDHVTGLHVGAMPLMEAARQAAIVTIEIELMRDADAKWGLVLNRFSSQFDNYVFPLPIEMIATLRDFDHTDAKVQLDVALEFRQVNSKICEMRLEGVIHKASFLGKIEGRRARKVVDEFLQGRVNESTVSGDLTTA